MKLYYFFFDGFTREKNETFAHAELVACDELRQQSPGDTWLDRKQRQKRGISNNYVAFAMLLL